MSIAKSTSEKQPLKLWLAGITSVTIGAIVMIWMTNRTYVGPFTTTQKLTDISIILAFAAPALVMFTLSFKRASTLAWRLANLASILVILAGVVWSLVVILTTPPTI